MNGPRPVRPLVAMATLLTATPVLAACGAGGPGGSPYVAEFGLGSDTPEAREFELTPMPEPRVQLLPAPSRAPRITLPDPGEDFELTSTPSPAPDSGGQSPLESAFQPSIAWVNDGEYLAVITSGSSSCPSGPDSMEVVAEQEIEVRLGPLFPDRDTCTADMSPHVTVVELPQGVTPTKPLVARFGSHEVTIEAVAR